MAKLRNGIPTSADRGGSSGPRTADELMALIEHRIATGSLIGGSRLDPVRTAAADFGLAPNTVATAYRRLQERGFVVSDGRRGTFVAETAAPAGPADQSVADGLIDLATGNPDRRLLPDLGPALRAISTEHRTERVVYGHDPIDAELAQLLAQDMAPDLRSLLPEGIVAGRTLAVVGGALDGIERTLTAHVRPGDRLAVEDPAYTSVLDLAAAMNLRTVPMAVDGAGVRPEALRSALEQGVTAVIITPRAQNPTGAAIDRSRADELAPILADHPGVLVLEDDHAGHVAGAAYCGVVSEATEHWAVIRSMAKSLGPDLRLAGLVGDPLTVNRVIGRQLLGTGWVSHILQQVVARLLASPETAGRLATAAEAYTARRRAFIDHLAGAGVVAEGRSGLNVWVPVEDEAEVVAGMQRRGFAIRSGARFRQAAPAAVRVSTACSEVDTLIDAADALIDVMGGGARARSV